MIQQRYSVPVSQAKPGQTSIRRHPLSKDSLSKMPAQINSFKDLWDQILKKHPQNKFCQEQTYSDVFKMACRVGSSLINKKHNTVFLYCKNCYEWTLTDVACMNYGVITVPLYDTLGLQAIEYIVNLTEGTALITKNVMVDMIITILEKKPQKLREIFFIGQLPQQGKMQKIKSYGVTISKFDTLHSQDQILQRPEINLDTVLSYNFTSGTTALPKGVITTHRMFLNVLYSQREKKDQSNIGPDDVHFSFLPIAHVFERLAVLTIMLVGGNMRYNKYLITQLLKGISEVRPTFMPLVPRLINRLYPMMKDLAQKQQNYEKIKMIFGGRIRALVLGSAPISFQKIIFLKKVLGCVIKEGYGQTQTAAGSFVTDQFEQEYGHVGGPIPSIEFKLVDIPEMEYYTNKEPPKGQICIRGQTVFKGYYKNPQQTKKTIDQQGWCHTGDVGMILPNGALKIIDRKKNIFKLQQGQYVCPQRIQSSYSKCPYVSECYVTGESLQNYCVGIINPNMELLPVVAKKMEIEQTDPVKLCQNKRIEDFILQQINLQGKQDGLFGFEQVKKIKLIPKPFFMLGIVTVTMKVQRFEARKVFANQIKSLYKQ